MTEVPDDLLYTSDHEWVRPGSGAVVRVGVTAHAAHEMGDIVYVSLPDAGSDVLAGDACGELESTKSVSDVFSPVSGVVTAINPVVADAPETINADPYGQGWLFEVEIADTAELDKLLDPDAYLDVIGEAD